MLLEIFIISITQKQFKFVKTTKHLTYKKENDIGVKFIKVKKRNTIRKISSILPSQLGAAAEYTDCFSAEG